MQLQGLEDYPSVFCPYCFAKYILKPDVRNRRRSKECSYIRVETSYYAAFVMSVFAQSVISNVSLRSDGYIFVYTYVC